MKVTTKAQRLAIKQVFDRQALTPIERNGVVFAQRWANYSPDNPQLTYRQFRRLVKPSYDCLMVPWCGMWLGIEKDGYTHS